MRPPLPHLLYHDFFVKFTSENAQSPHKSYRGHNETSPHEVTPIHPFLFPEGGGFHFVRPQGGSHLRPPCFIWSGSASRGVSDGEDFFHVCEKQGEGGVPRDHPQPYRNETPPPHSTPPPPPPENFEVGGSPVRPPLSCGMSGNRIRIPEIIFTRKEGADSNRYES